MDYNPKELLKEFNQMMVGIKHSIPQKYDAFIKYKEILLSEEKLPIKTKWLLLLVASVSQKCPVCISRAVQHCLDAGWQKEEILEACMVAVLIGGSSVMTYVTLVEKAIDQLSS